MGKKSVKKKKKSNEVINVSRNDIGKVNKKSGLIFYSTIFLAIALLCYLFPYIHDDWAWGTSIGIERLHSNFDNYNGRWFGNFTVLLITRSHLLKALFMSFCLTSILFFINKITNNNKISKWLSLFLLAAIPKYILSQGVVWTSAFANYVVSIFFVLIYIYCNRNIFDDEYKEPSKYKALLFLILGFVSALYVEHVTIYLVVLGLVTIIYKYIKFKKISLSSILYFLGVVLGTVLMFSNSAYSSVASGDDGYRTFKFANLIITSINSFFDVIYKELFFQNIVLNIMLSLSIVLFLFNYLKKNDKYKKLIYILILVLVSFPIYILLLKVNGGVQIFLKYTKYINGIFSIIYFISIFISALFVSDSAHKKKILFNIFSIVMLTAPLFVVTPIGSRCFFPIYILWIWLTIEFFLLSYNDIYFDCIRTILLYCCLTFFGYLLLIYGYIFKIDYERRSYIDNNKTVKNLVLPKLPYESYHWLGNPVDDLFVERFKLFYGIDESVDVEFVSIKEWNYLK